MTERQAAIPYFTRLSSPVQGILLMVGSGASFAVMMALVRHLSQDMHPFETAFFRNLFGVVFILP